MTTKKELNYVFSKVRCKECPLFSYCNSDYTICNLISHKENSNEHFKFVDDLIKEYTNKRIISKESNDNIETSQTFILFGIIQGFEIIKDEIYKKFLNQENYKTRIRL